MRELWSVIWIGEDVFPVPNGSVQPVVYAQENDNRICKIRSSRMTGVSARPFTY